MNDRRERVIAEAGKVAEQIRGALESNRVIGTAVGVLMSSDHLTASQASELLSSASQYGNRKLRGIGAEISAAGALPFRPTLVDELLTRVLTASD